MLDRAKDRRLRIFGECPVFPVFHDAHDLDAVAVDSFVIAPYRAHFRACAKAEDLACKLAIHHGYPRCVRIVMPGKDSACQQRGACRLEIAGRDVVDHHFRGFVGKPEIGCVVLEGGVRAPSQIQRHAVVQSDGFYTGDGPQGIDQPPLHLRHAVAAVACHIELGVAQHGILGLKSEIALERAHQAAHRDQRGGHQHGADRDLQDQQHVAHRKAPSGRCDRACFNDLIGIGEQHLTHRNKSEDQSAGQCQQQRNSVDPGIRIHGHGDGKIGHWLPRAEPSQQRHASEHSRRASQQGDHHCFGQQLPQNSLAARPQRQP